MRYLEFLTNITEEELIGNNVSVKNKTGRTLWPTLVWKKISVSNQIRFSNIGAHLPISTSQRRCAYCSTKNDEQRYAIEFSTCKVALCVSSQRIF